MLRKLSSIKSKILILYLILLIVTMVFAGYYLQYSLQNYFSQWMEEEVIKKMELVTDIINPLLEEGDLTSLKEVVNNFGDKLETRFTIIDLEGVPLADSREDPQRMENHLQRPEVQMVLEGEIGRTERYSSTIDAEMRYIALPVIKNGEMVGIVRGAMELDDLQQLFRGIWNVLLRVGVVVIIISTLLSLKMTEKITTPIERITSAAQKIANGFLDHKLMIRTEDEIGQLAEMFNYMVSRVKEKIEELSAEKNKIETIVTSIADGVIAVNDQEEVILFNPAAEDIFGIKEQDVLGKSIIQITKNYKLDQLIEKTLQQVGILTEELEILLPEKKIFRVQVAPIRGDRKTKGVVAVLRDITEIRRLERMRRDFVSNVSHELKTPLTSIKGYVETLIDSKLDYETAQYFLEIINDETNRLERLITDLLDLSKIESEPNLGINQEVDLVEVIKDVSSLLNNKAEEKEIDLKLCLPFEAPIIKGDPDQFARVMINLIDNAIKYTPQGGRVKTILHVEKKEAVIEVEDNGIGIPEQDLERVFERFYRVDKARTRKQGGTGLGLSIVKHIVRQYNGQIDVESELEQGTKFIIRFPLL
ncbi:phosphate regulon sensor histidine kinase PhoR [Natroniella sulfidigena]|uniref:two-component system histidine kinase PnpS n=1 Tax=Natroniella sulfidigena TaxID=723921 RepID=UPI00200AC4F7|nr:phosphate regulon sensor histidine kinase PhoR [Natroniella sulfidigena]MCK8817775.1 phosphate regulon sensor histidine kinase PhoR [Natroniella sulfidigena]